MSHNEPPTPYHGLSSKVIHAGEPRLRSSYSVAEPIHHSSTYAFANTEELLRFVVDKDPRPEYARYGNPTELVAEQKLASLDGAEDAVLYGSGMAALAGLVLGLLQAGDELILFDECYLRTRELFEPYLGRLGIRAVVVKNGDLAALDAAITPATKLLFCEIPTNPHLSVVDLTGWVNLAKRHGIATAVDATLATPFNIQPLAMGVDYVVHSCTKYLAGHNDLLAGVVVGSREHLAPLRKLRGLLGMINSPHDEYLLIRGLKTFELRMERHNANGMAVAQFLESHPRIERVYYPGLPSHADHAVARQLLRGFGGVVTFNVKDADWRQTAAVVDAVRIPRIAPSLGGAESLIEQPLVLSYWDNTPEQRREIGIPDNMVRLACGLENADDLIADLKQALQA